MANWETETYSVRSAPESEVAAELSYRASSGWELVSVVPVATVNSVVDDQACASCDLYFKRRGGPSPEEDVAASVINILRPTWVKEMSDILTNAEEKIAKASERMSPPKTISGSELIFGRRQAAVIIYCPESWRG